MNFWKLRHALFGTDFVHLENSADEIIRPVRYTHVGERYCIYFTSHLIWIDRPTCGWTVTPLTRVPAPALIGR